jgi:actin-related protein 2
MTAALLDSGDGVTHCIPVVDGYVLKHLITRMNIAGRHITTYLTKLMLMKYSIN